MINEARNNPVLFSKTDTGPCLCGSRTPMTIHALLQLVLYRQKAMGGHGIHSPFVYAFIENVIQDREKKFQHINDTPVFLCPSCVSSASGKKYSALANRMIAYLGYKDFLWINDQSHKPSGFYDLVVLHPGHPENWDDDVTSALPLLTKNSAIWIPSIHSSARHTDAWQNLCSSAHVLLSIDLYGVGLLFFREEFRERQHFILRSE